MRAPDHHDFPKKIGSQTRSAVDGRDGGIIVQISRIYVYVSIRYIYIYEGILSIC